jgi:hypothetical protein
MPRSRPVAPGASFLHPRLVAREPGGIRRCGLLVALAPPLVLSVEHRLRVI